MALPCAERSYITVRNDGPDPAKKVRLSEVAQAPMVLNTITPVPANASVICVAGATPQEMRCELGDIAKDAKITLNVEAIMPKGTTSSAINLAEARSPITPDPKPTNNVDNAKPEPADPKCLKDVKAAGCFEGRDEVRSAQADLAVTKTAIEKVVADGAKAVWSIEITNLGPDAANNVNLVDLGGVNHKLVSLAPATGVKAKCFTIESCVLDEPLAKGASVKFIAESTMGAGEAKNTVKVSTSTPEKELKNNEASADIKNPAAPARDVTKVDRPVPVSRTPDTPGTFAYTGSASLTLGVIGLSLAVIGFAFSVASARRRRDTEISS